METRCRALTTFVLLVLIAGCRTGEPTPESAVVPDRPGSRGPSSPAILTGPSDQHAHPQERALTPAPSSATRPEGLSAAQLTTLESLEQVDEHPLYVMYYQGAYDDTSSSLEPAPGLAAVYCEWACSLFAALGDPENRQFGRNFDWEFSPALLLFTDPPEAFASVSMVDIAYLGFGGTDAQPLVFLSLEELRPLLAAPLLPFDGMNERGVAIGMAAVAPGHMEPDPGRVTLGSLRIIREILDHAQNVGEALAIFGAYNIDFEGGPPLHYLVADRSGRSLLIEFYEGEMVVLANQEPWLQATNFLRAASSDLPLGTCWRFDRLHERLSSNQGRLTSQDAIDLLGDVAQTATQWSVVYGMSTGQVHIAMAQKYDHVHVFQFR